MRQKKFRLEGGKYYSNLGHVFCDAGGSDWNPDLFTAAFLRVVKRLVVTSFVLMTTGTPVLRAGVNAQAVSVHLGHSTVAFTQDVYGHLLPDLNETVAAAVDEKPGSLLNESGVLAKPPSGVVCFF